MEKSAREITKAAKRLVSLRDLRSVAGELEKHAEKTLGLADVEYVDHHDGTNMAEWRCTRCQKRWLSGIRLPCGACNAQAYQAMVDALRKAEKRPVSGMRCRIVLAIRDIMAQLELERFRSKEVGGGERTNG